MGKARKPPVPKIPPPVVIPPGMEYCCDLLQAVTFLDRCDTFWRGECAAWTGLRPLPGLAPTEIEIGAPPPIPTPAPTVWPTPVPTPVPVPTPITEIRPLDIPSCVPEQLWPYWAQRVPNIYSTYIEPGGQYVWVGLGLPCSGFVPNEIMFDYNRGLIKPIQTAANIPACVPDALRKYWVEIKPSWPGKGAQEGFAPAENCVGYIPVGRYLAYIRKII